MRETVIRYVAILLYAALAFWLVFYVGGWWIWLGAFLLLGLVHPATWRGAR
jgi:hypothetical protein